MLHLATVSCLFVLGLGAPRPCDRSVTYMEVTQIVPLLVYPVKAPQSENYLTQEQSTDPVEEAESLEFNKDGEDHGKKSYKKRLEIVNQLETNPEEILSENDSKENNLAKNRWLNSPVRTLELKDRLKRMVDYTDTAAHENIINDFNYGTNVQDETRTLEIQPSEMFSHSDIEDVRIDKFLYSMVKRPENVTPSSSAEPSPLETNPEFNHHRSNNIINRSILETFEEPNRSNELTEKEHTTDEFIEYQQKSTDVKAVRVKEGLEELEVENEVDHDHSVLRVVRQLSEDAAPVPADTIHRPEKVVT